MNNKPNYIEMGFSDTMGPKLRQLVETQLIQDLKFYGCEHDVYNFDWSESCIEGHSTQYLDGRLENYSCISVYDKTDEYIADGWMEFIHEDDLFIAYWEFVSILKNKIKIQAKKKSGIPKHILDQIPKEIRIKYKNKLLEI